MISIRSMSSSGIGVEFPDDTGKQRVINAASINQYLQFGGKASIETACRDGVAAVVDLGDFDAGRHAQDVGQCLGAGAADVFGGNDKGRSGNVGEALALARNRGDIGFHQFFKAEIVNAVCGCVAAWRNRGQEGDPDGRSFHVISLRTQFVANIINT